MKKVLMMMLPTCPHCKRADKMINELITEHPEYASVQIQRVDESKEVAFANSLDYYYVPTFYVDDMKIMEGVPSKDKIEEALKAALGE